MPAELPGYYFDASKNKYFRIQPNHIAPVGSKYAYEAVLSEKKVKAETQRHESRQQTETQQLLSRSRLLQHSSLSPLRRRLGDLHTSPSQLAAEEYASSLKPRQILQGTTPGQKFAIDPTTKALYAISQPEPGRNPEFSIFHSQPQSKSYIYSDDPSARTPIFDSPDLTCLAPLNPDYVIWSSSISSSRYPYPSQPQTSAIHFSRKFQPIDVAWNRADFGDYGTVRTVPETSIWDIAIPPGRDGWAVATGKGILLCASLGRDIRDGGTWNQVTNMFSPPGLPRKEMMCVEFRDANVFMAGSRSGKIWFGDRRGGSAMRLRHTSAVANVKVLRNENYILVNGLEQMSIYDLRYTHTRAHPNRQSHSNTTTTSSSPSSHSSTPQPTHNTQPSTRHSIHQHPRPRPSPLSTPPRSRSSTPKPNKPISVPTPITTPYLSFPLSSGSPTTPTQTNYGLGFAYDPTLNLIARATTDFRNGHCLTFWSATTGKVVRSPVNEYRFGGEGVTCVAFVDFEGDGEQDGTGAAGKSLVTLADGRILKWKF